MKLRVVCSATPAVFGAAHERFSAGATNAYACDPFWLNSAETRTSPFHQIVRLIARGPYPRRFAHCIAQGTAQGALIELTWLDADRSLFEPFCEAIWRWLVGQGLHVVTLAPGPDPPITSHLDMDTLMQRVTLGEILNEAERASTTGEPEPPLVTIHRLCWRVMCA